MPSVSAKEVSRLLLSVYWVAGLFLLLGAQAVRLWILSDFCANDTIFLGLQCYKNFGMIASISLHPWVIWLFYAVILIALFGYTFKTRLWKQSGWIWWVVVWAGIFSNILERLLAGFVLDYIKIVSGIFNLADAYIIIGVIGLVFKNFKFSNV